MGLRYSLRSQMVDFIWFPIFYLFVMSDNVKKKKKETLIDDTLKVYF